MQPHLRLFVASSLRFQVSSMFIVNSTLLRRCNGLATIFDHSSSTYITSTFAPTCPTWSTGNIQTSAIPFFQRHHTSQFYAKSNNNFGKAQPSFLQHTFSFAIPPNSYNSTQDCITNRPTRNTCITRGPSKHRCIRVHRDFPNPESR